MQGSDEDVVMPAFPERKANVVVIMEVPSFTMSSPYSRTAIMYAQVEYEPTAEQDKFYIPFNISLFLIGVRNTTRLSSATSTYNSLSIWTLNKSKS